MSETVVFDAPKTWVKDTRTHYCPGCTHGVVQRLICEVIDELGIRDDTIGIAPVGCAVFIHKYLDLDFIEVAHGRAPAVAYGIKAVRPDQIVFTYQGDGDLASIGMGEIVHAVNRGWPLTVIFANNATYGMTGGQMAPTTLMGQKTTTCIDGRGAVCGHPIKMCELLATLGTPAYIERVSVSNPKYVMKARSAIKKAFEYQVNNKGFSFVEILSTCPTNWGLRPVEACKWLEEQMIPAYPLAVFKDFE